MTPTSKEFSGNDVSDAIGLAVSHFNLPQEKLKIEVLETGSTGIFGFRCKKAKIRATPQKGARKKPVAPTPTPPPAVKKKNEKIKVEEKAALPIEVDEETLAIIKKEANTLLQHMGMSAEVTLSQDDAVRIHIGGTDDELLIGPEGKTLDSFQYLLRKIVSRMLGVKLALNVDAGDYRQRRTDELTAKSQELAQQAIDTRKTQAIPSLNPQERRVVHMAIRDNKMIRTKSIGNGLFKKVLIFPHDQKQPSKPRRGRQGGRRNQRS